MKYFFNQLRFVKWRDILACFTFLFALPVSFVFRHKRKNLWLVCERTDEARDNGYWFYRYMRQNHPETDCVYAISKKSPDYEKVKSIGGQVISFGTFKHWVYYLSAQVNISSQKEGKPNAAVCHLLEIYGIRKNKRVYLKHGIVKDDLKWHYYDVMKVWLYICAAKRERDYVIGKFSYPDDTVVLTGLCRYDNLDNSLTDKKKILILPTSREWLARPVSEYEKYDDINHFENTEFFECWKDLLTNEDFNRMISDNSLKVVFFLHPNMQKYSKHFKMLSENIEIAGNNDYDLQTLIKESACMITDFSSVYFDFAYMKKPLVYFHFDYQKYREGHYQEGYFSYKDDGFGPVFNNANDVVNEFSALLKSDFEMPEEYKKRVKSFFEFDDKSNCERVYKAITDKLKKQEEK